MSRLSTSQAANERHRRLRVHLQLIDDGVGPVVAAYRDHINCEAGCSSCCSQSFEIAEIEAELLVEGLGRLAPAERADIVARAQVHSVGAACPVLDEQGTCRLYGYRPRICRKYGIPLWNPESPERVHTCSLNFKDVADLDPELICEPQAAWAADWIALRHELAISSPEKRTIARWLAGEG